jgi:hypothetical protein
VPPLALPLPLSFADARPVNSAVRSTLRRKWPCIKSHSDGCWRARGHTSVVLRVQFTEDLVAATAAAAGLIVQSAVLIGEGWTSTVYRVNAKSCSSSRSD